MTKEKAIEWLIQIKDKYIYGGDEGFDAKRKEAIDMAIEALNKRPRGKWIEDAETFYKAVNEYGGGVDENTPYFTDDIACSKCLAKFSVIDNETERFDFCPQCGADMRNKKAIKFGWQDKEIYSIEDTPVEELQSARCPVCQRYHTTPYLYSFDNFRYCPSCGVQLEGDENDKETTE